MSVADGKLNDDLVRLVWKHFLLLLGELDGDLLEQQPMLNL